MHFHRRVQCDEIIVHGFAHHFTNIVNLKNGTQLFPSPRAA